MLETPDETLQAAQARDAELLLYDFHKHMTTLSLATLGGVLSIPQLSGGGHFNKDFLVPIGLVALAGVASLSALDSILKARLSGKPPPGYMRLSRQLASLPFGMGVGTFIAVFLQVIER